METQKIIRLRNKVTNEILYTIKDFPIQEIDGVEFIIVLNSQYSSVKKLMRKDSLIVEKETK